MTSVRKFQFDESFDVDSHHGHGHGHGQGYAHVEEVIEPEPPPAVYGEEDLNAAREAGFRDGMVAGHKAGELKGYDEGRAAGLEEGAAAARAEIEGSDAALAAHALDRIAQGVEALLTRFEAEKKARSDQPVHIALAIVRKLMPEMARQHGLAEIEGLVRACLTDLLDEPRLVIRVAPDALELVRPHLEETITRSGFDTRLMVVADANLGPGDCRIEWAEGGAERDTTTLLAEIEQSAQRLLDAGALH
ncbi:MAG TPA: FliH/SctL family protein [Azospirillum sp.]|nr:FliH/SctL family protein [Azospirillum sp.]